jgi:hypothetical protein
MRRLTAIFLFFVLVYAGATEALKGCLTHEDNSDHHHSEAHQVDSGIQVTHDHSPSPSWPIIHCPAAEQRLGPALQVASAKLSRLDQITSIHASFLREPASPASRNNLWREALFKIILTFSLPNSCLTPSLPFYSPNLRDPLSFSLVSRGISGLRGMGAFHSTYPVARWNFFFRRILSWKISRSWFCWVLAERSKFCWVSFPWRNISSRRRQVAGAVIAKTPMLSTTPS